MIKPSQAEDLKVASSLCYSLIYKLMLLELLVCCVQSYYQRRLDLTLAHSKLAHYPSAIYQNDH